MLTGPSKSTQLHRVMRTTRRQQMLTAMISSAELPSSTTFGSPAGAAADPAAAAAAAGLAAAPAPSPTAVLLNRCNKQVTNLFCLAGLCSQGGGVSVGRDGVGRGNQVLPPNLHSSMHVSAIQASNQPLLALTVLPSVRDYS